MKNENITLLAFDTATNACTVALCDSGRIFFRHDIAPRKHAALLLPMIHAVLLEAQIELQMLHAIAFGAGPGSFMGVRLATGTAQGLAFGLNICVIPISTLQTLAQTAYEKSGDRVANTMAAAWDARMSEIYCGIYQADHYGIMRALQADFLCAPAMIDTHLPCKVPCQFVGNAWSVYAKELPDALNIALQHPTDIYPEAKAMLTIAISKYLNNEIVSPINAHPHYIRHRVVHNHD